MSSSRKKFQSLKEASQPEEKSVYPVREQFACVRCKDKIFTSWNDFENHHAKHAVDFTFSQLPIVKLQQIQILNIKSGTQNISPGVNRNIDTTSPNPSVSQHRKDASCDDKELDSSENKSTEQEDLLTWPGSCESPSPVESPCSTSVGASNEIVSPACTVVDELHVDPNVLDPAFIEKLGEEIRFLNQSSVDLLTQTVEKESSLEAVQSVDVNQSMSPKSPADSFALSMAIPLIEPIIPETATTAKILALSQPSEDILLRKNVNDSLGLEKESVSPPKEMELPKSKGQLRLVPFESLLSPTRLPLEGTEEEEGSQNLTQILPLKSQNKQQAMVVIPEKNLLELNISDVTAPQQVWQVSRATLPPSVMKTMLPDPIPSILPLPQRYSITQPYQFHHAPGQGQHPPVVHQQQPNQTSNNVPQYRQHQPVYRQKQPVYRQQMVTGQQASPYATSSQYVHRFSNQQGMQYPPNTQSYPSPSGAIQPNDLSRANVSSAMAFASSHGSAQIHSVSTTSYLQQTKSNPTQLSSSPSHPQCQMSINNGIYNHVLHHSNTSVPHYPDRPPAPVLHHVQLQIPSAPSTRPSGSSAQTTVRQQMMVSSSQHAIRHSLSSTPGTAPRPQQVTQLRPGYVLILPKPSNGLSLSGSLPTSSQVTLTSQSFGTTSPSTSAASDATSSASRLPPPKYPGQQTSCAASRFMAQKRLLTCGGETSASCQPPHKIARAEEAVVVSAAQSDGDCEVRIVQKKQTGLPIIQSVEGGVNPFVTKASSQALQTPSVASLLSNPNITVTPAKNKENQAASDVITALKATSASTLITNGNSRTTCPITIDLTNTASASVEQRNPLQCQVCNETFSSQSLLKTHLVLHLKKVHPATIRPTGSQTVVRNLAPDQAVGENSAMGRSNPSNQRVRNSEIIMAGRSGCHSTANSSGSSKGGLQTLPFTRPMIDAEASSSASVINPVSNDLAVDTSTSRNTVSTVGGQSRGVVAFGTSDNASKTNKSETSRKGSHSPAIVATTAVPDSDVVNRDQQSKSGEALRVSKHKRTCNAMPSRASSFVQCSSERDLNEPPVEKATPPNNEYFIPVVDLRQQDVISQLESMGINQFIPASNLTSSTTHNDFAIPIMSATVLRRAGKVGFPHLSGAINLGSPKLFPSTSK